MKSIKKYSVSDRSKKINKLIADHQLIFKIPTEIIQDGADKLPTVQAPS